MGNNKNLILGFKIGIPFLLIMCVLVVAFFISTPTQTQVSHKLEKHGSTDAPAVPEEIEKTEKIIATLYMPDLIGASEEGAMKKLTDMGFYNVKTKHEESPEHEKGFVFKQSIPANTTVGTDFEITLHVAD